MTKRQLIIIGAVSLAVILGSVVGFVIYTNTRDSTIPVKIKKDVTFLIYYPEGNDGRWQGDASTMNFNADTQVLTLVARSDDNKVTLTEQATPDTFGDVPGYYARLLDKLHQYAAIQTAIGTVTLTRPEELKGGQSAVINTSRGTLMFAHPEHDLNEAQWKGLFNELRAAP